MNFSITHTWGVQARLACLAFACLSLAFGGAHYLLGLVQFATFALGESSLILSLTAVSTALGLTLATQFNPPGPGSTVPMLTVHVLVSSLAVPLLYLTSGETGFGLVGVGFFSMGAAWSLGWVYRGLIRSAPTLAPPAITAGLALGASVALLPIPMTPLFQQGLSAWFIALSAVLFAFQNPTRGGGVLSVALLGFTLLQMMAAPQWTVALEKLWQYALVP